MKKKIDGYEKVYLPKPDFMVEFEKIWNECAEKAGVEPSLMGKKARKKFNQYVAEEIDKQAKK